MEQHKIKTVEEVSENAKVVIEKYLGSLDAERKKLVSTLIQEAYIEGRLAGGIDIMRIFNK